MLTIIFRKVLLKFLQWTHQEHELLSNPALIYARN